MEPTPSPERTLTQTDHARLTRLIAKSGQPPPAAEAMQDVLDCSDVVPSPAVPPTVVTMYTQALLEDPRDGSEYALTLCYPADADPAAGQVSVLSPIGAAMLGLRVGEVASWRAPTGEARSARIRSILFQPEASGDYLR